MTPHATVTPESSRPNAHRTRHTPRSWALIARVASLGYRRSCPRVAKAAEGVTERTRWPRRSIPRVDSDSLGGRSSSWRRSLHWLPACLSLRSTALSGLRGFFSHSPSVPWPSSLRPLLLCQVEVTSDGLILHLVNVLRWDQVESLATRSSFGSSFERLKPAARAPQENDAASAVSHPHPPCRPRRRPSRPPTPSRWHRLGMTP